MYWDWRFTRDGALRFGFMLLSFSIVVKNELLLNKEFLPQIPVGSILLLIILLFILRHIYRTLKWYSKCFNAKKYRINVLFHFCLYLIVFSIALSFPATSETMPSTHPITEQPSTQPVTKQPIITEQITKSPSATESVTTVTDISNFKTNPKTVDYTYVLRGSHGHITYTVYGGLNDYLKELPRGITHPTGDIDYMMRDLNDENQKQFLDPLVDQIKAITPNQDDQARIAISLVQNLDYDWYSFRSENRERKYPYEVLYTGCGVCSGKSELLAYLLRGLGYGVVIFHFDPTDDSTGRGHAAVGLKCPQQYSYKNTGYCFVESTSPSIITDSSKSYFVSSNSDKTAKLPDTFDTLQICDGKSFDSVSEEYKDAITYNSFTGKKILSQSNYAKWKHLVNKYGINIAKK